MPYRRMKRLSMPFSNRSRSSWFLRDRARACSNRASSCCRLVLSSVSSLLQLTRPTRLYGCSQADRPQKCCKSCPGGPTLWSGRCLHCSSGLAGKTCPPHALLGQAGSERHLHCMASGPAITMVLDRRTSHIPSRPMSLLSPGGGFRCSAGTKVGSTLLNAGPGVGGVGS